MSGYGPVPFQNQDPNAAVTRTSQEELYAQLLNHMQGAFGTESQIDMVAPNGEADPDDLEAGRVAHLNSDGAFELGLGGNVIPYFLKPAGGYHGMPKTGNVYGDGVLALPAVASYRLCTNTFVAGTYAPNDPLTVHETSGADKGKIKVGRFYEDTIVGIVARGKLTNYDKPGRDVIEFFTYFLPSLDTYSTGHGL